MGQVCGRFDFQRKGRSVRFRGVVYDFAIDDIIHVLVAYFTGMVGGVHSLPTSVISQPAAES